MRKLTGTRGKVKKILTTGTEIINNSLGMIRTNHDHFSSKKIETRTGLCPWKDTYYVSRSGNIKVAIIGSCELHGIVNTEPKSGFLFRALI